MCHCIFTSTRATNLYLSLYTLAWSEKREIPCFSHCHHTTDHIECCNPWTPSPTNIPCAYSSYCACSWTSFSVGPALTCTVFTECQACVCVKHFSQETYPTSCDSTQCSLSKETIQKDVTSSVNGKIKSNEHLSDRHMCALTSFSKMCIPVCAGYCLCLLFTTN